MNFKKLFFFLYLKYRNELFSNILIHWDKPVRKKHFLQKLPLWVILLFFIWLSFKLCTHCCGCYHKWSKAFSKNAVLKTRIWHTCFLFLLSTRNAQLQVNMQMLLLATQSNRPSIVTVQTRETLLSHRNASAVPNASRRSTSEPRPDYPANAKRFTHVKGEPLKYISLQVCRLPLPPGLRVHTMHSKNATSKRGHVLFFWENVSRGGNSHRKTAASGNEGGDGIGMIVSVVQTTRPWRHLESGFARANSVKNICLLLIALWSLCNVYVR